MLLDVCVYVCVCVDGWLPGWLRNISTSILDEELVASDGAKPGSVDVSACLLTGLGWCVEQQAGPAPPFACASSHALVLCST